MRTSAPGSSATPAAARRTARRGFTLLELMVVVAIAAIATLGVSFAIRDSAGAVLERDARRLAAQLDAARAQSRLSGRPVQWAAVEGGFRFEGLAGAAGEARRWLGEGTQVAGTTRALWLGPEPIIAPQSVTLVDPAIAQAWEVATDGLRPFQARPAGTP